MTHSYPTLRSSDLCADLEPRRLIGSSDPAPLRRRGALPCLTLSRVALEIGDRERVRVAQPHFDFAGAPATAAFGELMLRRKGPGGDLAVEGGAAEAGQVEHFIEAHEAEGGLKSHATILHLLG